MAIVCPQRFHPLALWLFCIPRAQDKWRTEMVINWPKNLTGIKEAHT